MDYSKMFSIDKLGVDNSYRRSGSKRLADRMDEPVYEYTPEIELAINIALATSRPLLVRGSPGSGKSSLAKAIAHQMNWRYYEAIITSRTNAEDLLWTFNNLRRLNDAQVNKMKEDSYYIRPGVLWWAFDSSLAREFGTEEPFFPQPEAEASVVLIDEIDKAEPDLPNNLLVPLGSMIFPLNEFDLKIKEVKAKYPPLIVITTNDERKLPNAFLRRCVILDLKSPDAERLKRIAIKHFGERNDRLYEDLAQSIIKSAKEGKLSEPNAAEFLDAVWACICLEVNPPKNDEKPSTEWELIRNATVLKSKE